MFFSLWPLFTYFKTIQKATRKPKYTLYIIAITWLLSIFVVIFSNEKSGAELQKKRLRIYEKYFTKPTNKFCCCSLCSVEVRK